MSVAAMFAHLLRERLARREQARVPEAEAVMETPAQIEAYRDEGMLTHVHAFHAAMSLRLIRPGDTVLDLACGPARQLAHIARLHPDARFIGLDASGGMLELARAAPDLPANIELRQGDMTRLEGFAPAALDCVVCTMSLHHLPDTQALRQAMRQIARVLKPDGGIYLADFGRLKHAATQHYFARDRADEQSAPFTTDFLASLRAAFSVRELADAAALLQRPITQRHTALAPFLTLLATPPRRAVDEALRRRARAAYRRLTPQQRRDFDNLARWFRLGGAALPFR